MGVSVLLLLLFVSTVFTSPLIQDEAKTYKRFIEYFTEDGESITMDLEAKPDIELLTEIRENPDSTQFWLYTRTNPDTPQILNHGDAWTVLNSNLRRAETIIVVHGWVSNGNTEPNPSIRSAYLENHDGNVITVDWRRLAMSDYVTAVQGVPEVGRHVGQFVDWLVINFGLSYDEIHIVGFGLGAHLAGFAGKETGGKIARITGLDPEGNLWTSETNRLSSTDAVYVEAIHTDGGPGGYGIDTNIADIDFYPNGGRSQPNCFFNICNHNRSWQLFASSLTFNHFYSNLCTSQLQLLLNLCTGESNLMGNDQLFKSGTPGSYGLITAGRYPY